MAYNQGHIPDARLAFAKETGIQLETALTHNPEGYTE